MLLLTGTSDKIQVITASGVSTINVQASWVDMSGTTVTPGRGNFNISTAATTDVVALITGSTQRNIKTLSVYNSHATSSDVITIQHTDGSTISVLVKYPLLAGESIFYGDEGKFSIFDAAGRIKQSLTPGRYLIGVSVLTTGTAFPTSIATNHIFIRLQAGGGGGGGCAAVAAGGAGGGSAGGYAEKYFAVSPATVYSYSIGALGTGGSGNTLGNGGGNSTFTVGATTVTANGGLGGGGTAGGAAAIGLGGASPAISTNGDVNCGGSPGRPGMSISTSFSVSGGGGSSYLGPGANGTNAATTGPSASVGFGGGGGGGNTGSAVARNGGSGANGCIIVEEYS